MTGLPDLDSLKSARKAVVANALAAVETGFESEAVAALLDAAWEARQAQVVGLTGPPGVGKSTLVSALLKAWRSEGRRVAVVAVDPSSRRSGGALLGDRTRIKTDPEDQGLFVRSMAARDRLGGLASLTFPSVVLLAAAYDVVLVETVGVGQSETDIHDVADTLVFCIQPGSGDSLQFMKAGIMEIPDIAVVTKADMGPMAARAAADVSGALSLTELNADWSIPVLCVSATEGHGIDALVTAISAHGRWRVESGRSAEEHLRKGEVWMRDTLREQFGREGLKILGSGARLSPDAPPFTRTRELAQMMRGRIGT